MFIFLVSISTSQARPDLKMEFFHLMSFLLSHCTNKWRLATDQVIRHAIVLLTCNTSARSTITRKSLLEKQFDYIYAHILLQFLYWHELEWLSVCFVCITTFLKLLHWLHVNVFYSLLLIFLLRWHLCRVSIDSLVEIELSLVSHYVRQ